MRGDQFRYSLLSEHLLSDAISRNYNNYNIHIDSDIITVNGIEILLIKISIISRLEIYFQNIQ